MAIPIMLGYIPAGLAFGVLAREAGFSVLETSMMSLMVFAGSAQFTMIAQMSSGVPGAMVVLTCAIVNLRYLLMNTSVAARLSRTRPMRKFILGYMTSDETYVVNCALSDHLTPDEFASPGVFCRALGVDVASYLTWFLSTTGGCVFGAMLGDVGKFGADFGLSAVFIALLAPRLKDRKQLRVALYSGVICSVCILNGFGSSSVIIASAVAATLGVLLP
ncbi:MAG: AzlC family ABC transporter permease [Synergistaceae bacterium]|jgi:4-azaleucine resistance transporter AzlC|nr:AzlC family ABC transporter permease [Synergistaceae bacterium]